MTQLGILTAFSTVQIVLIYAIRDYFELPEPVLRGGLYLSLIPLTAVVALALWARLGGPARLDAPANWRRSFAAYPLVAFTVALILLVTHERWLPSDPGLVLISILGGLSYGAFAAVSRMHASRYARRRPDSAWLRWHNNLFNFASLGAFAVIAVVEVRSPEPAAAFYRDLCVTLGAVLIVSTIACFAFLRRERRRGDVEVPS